MKNTTDFFTKFDICWIGIESIQVASGYNLEIRMKHGGHSRSLDCRNEQHEFDPIFWGDISELCVNK